MKIINEKRLPSKSEITASLDENSYLLRKKNNEIKILENNFNSKFSKSYEHDISIHSQYAEFSLYFREEIEDIKFTLSFKFYIKFKENKVEIFDGRIKTYFFDDIELHRFSKILNEIKIIEKDLTSIESSEYKKYIEKYFSISFEIEKIERDLLFMKSMFKTIKHKDTIDNILDMFPSLGVVNKIENENDLEKFINENMFNEPSHNNVYLLDTWTYSFFEDKIINIYKNFRVTLSEEEPDNLNKATFLGSKGVCSLEEFIEDLNSHVYYFNDNILFEQQMKNFLFSRSIFIKDLPILLKSFFDEYEQIKLSNKLGSF